MKPFLLMIVITVCVSTADSAVMMRPHDTAGFASTAEVALAPKLTAAEFHTPHDPAHLKTIQQIIENAPSRVEAVNALHERFECSITDWYLSKLVKRHGLATAWQRLNPDAVATIVHASRNPEQALINIREAFRRHMSKRALSVYLKRHNITVPWLVSKVSWEQAESVIAASQTVGEAVEQLRQRLGWCISPSHLSRLAARHNSSAPWRNWEPSDVERLLSQTTSLTEAQERLRGEFGRSISKRALVVYLRRHRITVAWYRSRTGSVRMLTEAA